MNENYFYAYDHDNPCKDCRDRKSECHGICSLYLKWKKERDAYNDKIKKEKNKKVFINHK